MRTISQSSTENQTGISLWTLEDVLKAQEKRKALEIDMGMQAERDEEMDGDDEYGDGGLPDEILAEMEVDP